MSLRKSLEQKRPRRSESYLYDTANFDEAVYAQEIAQDRREQLRNSSLPSRTREASAIERVLMPGDAKTTRKQGGKSKIVRVLLQKHGRTFSEELGIDLTRPGPATLFRWLCATLLFSTRISANIAVKAAQSLARQGWTTPQKMAAADWADRTRTLNESGYARYDESTSTKLGAAAELILREYGGDLRNLREAAQHSPARERELLEEFKGIGDVGADIFSREIQSDWEELFPFADQRALAVAKKLGLGNSAEELAKLVPKEEFPKLLTALVRCGLAREEEAILGA